MKAPQHEHRTAAQHTVAANVRAELSRERWSGRKAAEALGYTQPYLSRRLTGELPFDVNELTAIAALLNVPVARFFTGTKKAPAVTRTTRASVLLPDLGSNQEPAVSWRDQQQNKRYRVRRHPHPRRFLDTRRTTTHPKNRPSVPRLLFTSADLYTP